MKLNTLQIEKFKKIKLVVSDVDGVLTDGGMYYSDKGEILKKFNTKDGMAVELLLENNIKTVFITKEKSKIVVERAKKVKVADVFVGIVKKEDLLPKLCKKFNVKTNEIAYIGDDINDIEIMKKIGFSFTPSDAIEKVQKISHYVCKTKGGEGVLREVTELILLSKN